MGFSLFVLYAQAALFSSCGFQENKGKRASVTTSCRRRVVTTSSLAFAIYITRFL
ncbi:hypothetical protein MtrunA17_Chr6g0469831 [Medicago truncatula]|uniref:Uncharacterized protein n=1 Tax=Medicago truncatula TaxID=3880 RepID=A0A396HE64_MEDTR|nr:hypothetical protein MtrunA17_Chr6g0469831 [Medicago truncatula]